MNKLKILKVKDKSEKHYIHNGKLFDLPSSIIICGRSLISGKSSIILNLLLRKEFKFGQHFKGENIYIVSPSTDTDYKLKTLIKQKDIPESNIFTEYSEEGLEAVSDHIREVYEEDKSVHQLIIFDDASYSGVFKKKRFGILAKMFQNSRHEQLSIIATTQTYTDIGNNLRSNSNILILFGTSDRILDTIADENAYAMSKKAFKEMFKKYTKKKHSFIVINYQNNIEERYLDSDFNPIDIDNL
tara:strand:+ start:852 stop:1580 length:729 start_codon:yes stop_codon:yes gene_type:complete